MTTATQNQSPRFEFGVDSVEPATRSLAAAPMHVILRQTIGEIESCSDYHTSVLCGMDYHPLLAAVYTAYSRHYPLVFTPDSLWITITQGIAQHMVLNAERLRERFVAHEGQLRLAVVANDWVEQSPENPWADVLEAWCDQIRDHVGPTVSESLRCDFSTTSSVDRAVSHIVMMDVFRRYFRYELYAVCGIPSITLEGTLADWQKLRSKLDELRVFDIDWWLDKLEPLIDQFVRARGGDIDLDHWQNVCKLQDAYGGSQINGWVCKLFPYVRSFTHGPATRRNPALDDPSSSLTTQIVPSGLSIVPFEFVRGETRKPKEVVGGLVGVTQDQQTLALRPLSGWAIRAASPIDQLIHRLRAEQAVTEIEAEKRSLYEETQTLDRSEFPFDYDRVQFEIGEAQIGATGSSIRLVSKRAIVATDWGEESDEFGSSRGPDDKTWFRFADLDDGRFLLLNLDVNCWDPRDLGYDPSFCPICVASEETIAVEGANPVVAFTFSEWLEKTLDWKKAKRDGWYWDATDFEPYGDAMQFTRITER